jgi:transcriptional regulator with XRE-family HTH domain
MGFGQRVRAIRQQQGLSLNDLEQRTGVNKGYLSQLEREAQRNPSVHIAKRIADALGLALDDLLAPDERPAPGTAWSAADLPTALARFVSLREKQGRPLSPGTVRDLSRIRFRGEYPQQPEQYEVLVNQLEMFTRKRRET